MKEQTIILFDGICNLCCGWVQILLRYDKQDIFTFVSIQSEPGIEILKQLELSVENQDSIIYIKDNQPFTESSAVFEIIKDTKSFWGIFLIFKILPKKLNDFIYRSIARNRYAIFGKKTTCYIPYKEN